MVLFTFSIRFHLVALWAGDTADGFKALSKASPILTLSPLSPCCPTPTPVITSSSTREYTVTQPEQDGAGPSNIHTYQWRQTITFQECVHDNSRSALPSTQQLSVDSVFVLYNQEERILRYALSNSIGPVRGERRQLWLGSMCAARWSLSSVTCCLFCLLLSVRRKLC